ncbi:glycoside hydrolase family protein [Actinokineospora bangkokensis]|uniref:Beta-xylosidase n=1 Tax=Actinokineospora bangkokensis TaxID=1193682 RepID=A0A1Q9LI35_9PSEU|nr:beta-xylosidase [Actinokineospora bangkokensis]OLR91701.1 beta-xylosidase [Actinokineospora bangkokensis]
MPTRLWRVRRAAAVLATLVALVPAAACSVDPPAGVQGPEVAPIAQTETDTAPLSLGTDRVRGGGGVVAAGGRDSVYNYGPTLMVDGGRYRMWWCSQLGIANPPGDDILLAEAKGPGGPYTGPDGTPGTPVFSGSFTGFDAVHTCDPSVIKVGGTYYLYYTGAAGAHANGNAIGLATSRDGRVWSRANGGAPIVSASHNVHRANEYGAGQPAVAHVDGWFYLMFTDTTGRGAGRNGAGQFVLRARDPAFGTDVELLGENGFERTMGTGDRDRSVVDAFSADLMWVDALDAFAIAHETSDGTTLTFWDREFRRHPYQPAVVRGPWKEGPGLVRDPEGHALPSLDDPCQRVPVDLVRATTNAAAPTDLRWYGADLTGTAACLDATRALRTLEGFAMPSPERTIDLVLGGKVVRVERRAVADRLAVKVLDRRVPALDSVPVEAHLTSAAPGVRIGPKQAGLLLDDKRLWALSDPALAATNSSALADITPRDWAGYQRGPDLVARR